jgi:hypothetical protein
MMREIFKFMDADDLDGLMSLCLTCTAALVNAETTIADLRAKLDQASSQDGDDEIVDDPASWTWDEPEAVAPPALAPALASAPEPEEVEPEAPRQHGTMETGTEVLKRCLARRESAPRPSSYLDPRGRERLIPAWKSRSRP